MSPCCSRCGGSVRVIACIEAQESIDRILAYLRRIALLSTLYLNTSNTEEQDEMLNAL